MDNGPERSRFSLVTFVLCACIVSFSLGVGVGRFRVFPYSLFAKAKAGYDEFLMLPLLAGRLSAREDLPWYYSRVSLSPKESVSKSSEAMPGLNLATRVANRLKLAVELRDMNGEVMHRWKVNWFDVWPQAEHLPRDAKPKSKPGTHIHGTVLLPNGNLVFNYDHLGTVCLDPRSRVVWRLPYRTHHSIHLHDDGTLWVCAQKTHELPDEDFPARDVPFDEYLILNVSPEGKVLGEWSVDRLLKENGLSKLLASNEPLCHLLVQNDILHLNDAEPFPSEMESGAFGPGDIMVSLRNVDTVFVFNKDTCKIKYISKPGMFKFQHDPDFIDGNTFSVFDNNVLSPTDWEPGAQSRIVTVSAIDDSVHVVFEGTPEQPFFSRIMGKHQWLENGNLLITDSMSGRAFEVDRQGDIVWEWINIVDRDVVGLVEQVQRLPDAALNTVRTGI